MAAAEIRPDWTIGTLNLTSGSTSFTTTGSMLQTAAIQPGDEIITRSGLVLIIASITGQNSGTLMEPCPAGAAGSGQPLRIRFQPDGSRYNGATADLVQLLSSGNVHSLSGIVGANNTMPYFTGVGTMGRTPLTAFARSLLDDANAEAMRDTLGLSGNGIATLALENYGRYGSGASGININDLPVGDRGLYATSLVGAPAYSGVPFWFIETQRVYTGDAKVQTAIAYSPDGVEPVVAVRSFGATAGAYSPWRYLIPERGSNANGEFVRFADGTQICKHIVNVTNFVAAGSIFRSSPTDWVYPAPFTGSPPSLSGNATGSSGIWVSGTSTLTQSSISGSWNAALSTSWNLSVTAIGRWF